MRVKFLEHDASFGCATGHNVIVVGMTKERKLLPSAEAIDKHFGYVLSQYIQLLEQKTSSDDTSSGHDTAPAVLMAPRAEGAFSDVSYLVLVSETDDLVTLGAKVAARVNALKKDHILVMLDHMTHSQTEQETSSSFESRNGSAAFAYGYKLRSWSFDKYLTKDSRKVKLPLMLSITIPQGDVDGGIARAEEAFAQLDHIYDSVALTRTFQSEPANVLYPESFANQVKELEGDGLVVEVMTRADLEKLGFGALLGVAQGSAFDARLVVMRWHGGAQDEAPFAFVGKGVTFDSGGLSIKPANRMEDMKHDMSGAAVVAGLLHAAAKTKIKANIVGILGLVENMPSGTAQRPGDIVTSLSGQTIEIINTDAEGRLVLADALWYTQERFKPKAMIDLATLTGAIVVALGSRYAGLFSNTDHLVESLKKSSATTDEKVWHLPLDKEFEKALKADQADFRNSDYNVGAGSTMAAQFLERFVNDTPWAHLDIAGTAWRTKASNLAEKGATGFGVRLLYQWLCDQI